MPAGLFRRLRTCRLCAAYSNRGAWVHLRWTDHRWRYRSERTQVRTLYRHAELFTISW